VIAWPPKRAQASRSAVGRAGRAPTPAPPTRLALVIAAVIVGCAAPAPSAPALTPGPRPSPSPSADGPAGSGLLLLATADDEAVLTLVKPTAETVALPLPHPSTMSVTPMLGGTLVALLADGRAFVAPSGQAGLIAGARWRPLDLRWAGALPRTSIIFGATASPDGRRLAAIARPPDAESPSALVVVEPAAGRGRVWQLADESTGVPPAWLDESSVAVVQRGRDGRTFLAVLAVATGEALDRIHVRALQFQTSGDTRTAVVLGDESRLLVGPTADVLERRRVPDEGAAIRPGDVVRGGVALDHDGRRLAAVVEDVAGVSRIATFESVGDAWQPGVRIPAPSGSRGGWVSWLP